LYPLFRQFRCLQHHERQDYCECSGWREFPNFDHVRTTFSIPFLAKLNQSLIGTFCSKFEELGVFAHGHERRESSDQEPAEVAPEPSSDLPEATESYSDDLPPGEEEGIPEDAEEDLMLSMRRNYRNSVVSNLSFEMGQFENFDFRLDENRATVINTEVSLEFLDEALDRKLENLAVIEGLEEAAPGDRGTIIAEEEEEEEGRKTPTQTHRPSLSGKPPLSSGPTVEDLQSRIAQMEADMRKQQESLIELFTEEQRKSKQLEETISHVCALAFSPPLFVLLFYGMEGLTAFFGFLA